MNQKIKNNEVLLNIHFSIPKREDFKSREEFIEKCNQISVSISKVINELQLFRREIFKEWHDNLK